MSSSSGKQYSALVKQTARGISERQGLYLWGYYTADGDWLSTYVGMTTKKKTSCLRERIRKELQAERWFLWHLHYDAERIDELRQAVHPGRYRSQIAAHILKVHSTHVFWMPVPTEEGDLLSELEATVIRALQPTANLKRPPAVPTQRKRALEVVSAMRTLIAKSAVTRYFPQPLETADRPKAAQEDKSQRA